MTLRLIILAIVALAFAGLVAAVYKYRGDAIGARAEAARISGELQKAVDAVRDREKTINDLKLQAVLDADLTAELQDDLNAANASTLALAQRVADLKSRNPDVETFLGLRVPGELRGLYATP